jgi:hypothetical protein
MKMSKCHLFRRCASISIICTPRTRVDSRGDVKVTPVVITKHCIMLLGLLVRGKFIGAKRHTATPAPAFFVSCEGCAIMQWPIRIAAFFSLTALVSLAILVELQQRNHEEREIRTCQVHKDERGKRNRDDSERNRHQ